MMCCLCSDVKIIKLSDVFSIWSQDWNIVTSCTTCAGSTIWKQMISIGNRMLCFDRDSCRPVSVTEIGRTWFHPRCHYRPTWTTEIFLVQMCEIDDRKGMEDLVAILLSFTSNGNITEKRRLPPPPPLHTGRGVHWLGTYPGLRIPCRLTNSSGYS